MQFLEQLKPLGLFVLRAALGIIFMYHGYPKLFGDPGHTVQQFVKMGFPGYFAYLAGVLELFGGGLMVIGLFTRGIGLLLAIEMGVALVKVHIPQAGIYAVTKYDLPLILGAAALGLATTGAGLISLDALTFESRRKAPKRK
jgi:putative oxidoreductase